MANLKSLNEIFNNNLFRIPDYQRGFAWTRNQLNDFWDDLYNLSEKKGHYTGVLTVKTITPSIIETPNWNEEKWLLYDRGYKAYYVVDGQQRLTTSVVFIQALYEIIKNIVTNTKMVDSDIYVGTFSLKEIRETYIMVSKPPHNIINTYKFGYETDNPSFKFLKHKIFNEPDSGMIDETFYTLNLENAKRFFLEKIDGVFKKEGVEGISTLFKKLIVNFKFNFYEIEEDFDVYVAFETMNNRGKKLSNLELLKNRLIYLTTLYDTNELKDDDRISLRYKIDEAWKEVYYQLGRNKNHPLNDDEFLVAHWIMYFQYTRQKGDDYIEFLLNEKFTPKNIFEKEEIPVTSLEEFQIVSEKILEEEEEEENDQENGNNVIYTSKLKPEEIEDYVNSLKSAAVHWYNTHNPINNKDLHKDEQLWIERLNRIGIGYFRPLVTASFLKDDITSLQRIELLKGIERFIFIAFRLGRAFATYRNSEFYRAARRLRSGEKNIYEIILALEHRMNFSFVDRNATTIFDHLHFKKYIDRNFKNGFGFYRWNGLRYFLHEYEINKFNIRGNKKLDWPLFVKGDRDKVSIEHILPQTPQKICWQEVLKGFSEVERNILLNTLGNLLLLSQSINSSLQNDCFDEKKIAQYDNEGNNLRLGYNDGSHSENEVSQYKEWTSKQILKRGLDLLSFMEKRWNLKFESEDAKIDLLGLSFLRK